MHDFLMKNPAVQSAHALNNIITSNMLFSHLSIVTCYSSHSHFTLASVHIHHLNRKFIVIYYPMPASSVLHSFSHPVSSAHIFECTYSFHILIIFVSSFPTLLLYQPVSSVDLVTSFPFFNFFSSIAIFVILIKA